MSVDDMPKPARRLQGTFAGRCVAEFFAMQGIDRAMAIAAQAFTALIPLLLLTSSLVPVGSRNLVADGVVHKFRLTGDAAAVVQELFASPGSAGVGLLSVVLLLFSGVSFTRRVQRMYLQAWRLEPRPGVRGSLNAAFGLAALVLEIVLLSVFRNFLGGLPFGNEIAWPVSLVAGAVLWTFIPWLLLDRRVDWHRLLPAGVLAAVCATLYGLASAIYMPHLLESYSRRYGLFGVTLTLVSWLLCIAFIVLSATVVAAEFDRADERWARQLRARLHIPPAPEE